MNEQIEDRNPVEVAAEEFASRVRSGECPSVTEYVDRYPDYAEEISDLLPTVAAMEQLRRTENAQRQTAQLSTLAPRNLPECIGDYRILREIGRGGMGVVYEAQQESLGRLVALKVLTRNRVSSPKHIDRFHREAQSAANLHHTNIVPVFGVGEQDELHYYVMQLIEGVGLDQVISELRLQAKLQDKDPLPPTGSFSSAQMVASEDAARSLRSGRFASGSRSGSASTKSDRERNSKPSADSTFPVPVGETESSIGPKPPLSTDALATDVTADYNSQGELSQSAKISPDAYEQLDDRYWKSVARIGVQLAHALDYAHNQHVLHRDIKPSNLLLDRNDTVWITDFGLAKQADADELTKTGDIVGTLRYMAPEQFNGICNRQTDIYSLGVTLFELLTLRPAFGESQQGLLIQKITTAGIDRPRSVNPSIPRDLETIVMKATANESDRRFRTAGELADDLQRYLDDRPIKARRVTTAERMWRWSRRNPAIASLAATLLLVVFSSLVVISWKWGEAERGKQEAQKQSELARTQSSLAQKESQNAQIKSELAQKESDRAATENRRAEANLSLALDSMDRFLEHFASSWMAHPSEPVNDEDEEAAVEFRMIVSDQSAIILQDALKFYNQFARKNASNPRLLRDTAKAYQRVGAIHERLGQYVRAEKAYNDAIEILADLQQQFPSDADVAVQTGATVNQLGLVFMALGRYEDAKLEFDRARDTLAVQLVKSANSEECQYELARAFSNLGHVSWRLGKGRDAIKNHREALGQFEQLVEQNPQRAEYRLALSRSYRSVFPSGKYGSPWGDRLKIRLQAITIQLQPKYAHEQSKGY